MKKKEIQSKNSKKQIDNEIWEQDVLKNKDKVINECIEFIKK